MLQAKDRVGNIVRSAYRDLDHVREPSPKNLAAHLLQDIGGHSADPCGPIAHLRLLHVRFPHESSRKSSEQLCFWWAFVVDYAFSDPYMTISELQHSRFWDAFVMICLLQFPGPWEEVHSEEHGQPYYVNKVRTFLFPEYPHISNNIHKHFNHCGRGQEHRLLCVVLQCMLHVSACSDQVDNPVHAWNHACWSGVWTTKLYVQDIPSRI